ncbi:MAG: DUF368 domain-containing protein [Chloroflexi bacterium]|nr:DUF368 domain-containing protein [Chloroflexota bacterium]
MNTNPADLDKPETKKDKPIAWIVRLLKGFISGIGAITPGLSGGVMMVVFGIYEPLLKWLADIRKNFLRNLLFFIPVGIGGVIGVVAFSAAIDKAYDLNAVMFTWLIIGFIIGTYPSILKTAGKEGRKVWHVVMMVLISGALFFALRWMQTNLNIQMPQNFWIWMLCGALTGLGLIVPGLSPSNFLMYMGLYQPMAAGVKSLNFGVIIPMMIGLVAVIFAFAKLVSWLFKKHYAVIYHIILGVVFGSILAIIPVMDKVKGLMIGADAFPLDKFPQLATVNEPKTIIICVLLAIAGFAASFILAKLDEKHPHESLF